MADAVNHPVHYQAANDPEGVYEAIKIIDAWGLLDDFCLGNCLKYICRAGKKGSELEDLRKARWYLDYKIRRTEEKLAGS